MESWEPGLVGTLKRGARRKCPRCGQGALFRGWYSMHKSCDTCDLLFEPQPGDTWGFWVLMDRVFLLVAMVILYFGFRPENKIVQAVFLLAVAVPMVWTMPHRQGIATALDYYIRQRTNSP